MFHINFGFSKETNISSLKYTRCNNPKIKLINIISSDLKRLNEKDIFDSIFDFIFGEEKNIISNPFNLVYSKGKVFFIDQKSKSIVSFETDSKDFEILDLDGLKLDSPVGLCILEDNLLFTDSKNNKIYKYNFTTEEVTILNSSLNQPTGLIYLKSKKEIWVCDTKSHQIIILDINGNKLRSIGNRGSDFGKFNYPIFICNDNEGKVYVNDSMNFRIQILSEDGEYINSFGKTGDGAGDLARPKGIATDSFGNIYIVDALFNNIQVFNQEGNLLYGFGEKGGSKEKFWLPAGIFIDDENKIYIADTYNSRIQIFQLVCDDEINK